ncbi:MAG TPA: PA14 domain-containing protein, partial [Chloroflexota bacterium]|nr:PA14 domain-containing protein [Chloroflexota bacterium]
IGDGATWYETQGGVQWKTAGVDYTGTAAASLAVVSGETEKWHAFTVTSLVQDWVTAKAPNHGVLVKLDDATLTANRAFAYLSDDYTVAPTLRPKLAVTYVDNSTPQGPSVSVAAPGAGSKISGSAVKITALASDDRRVETVEFYRNNVLAGTDTSKPYELTWDTTGVANGTYTLHTKAFDDAGNATTSASVSVTVANSAPPAAAVTGLGAVPTDTWRGAYFPNKSLSGDPVALRDDTYLDFWWGWGSPITGVDADNFSVRWVRAFEFDGGCYALDTASDDGMRISLDGVQVGSYWFDQAAAKRFDEVCPSAGYHTVQVEYYEGTGEARAYVDVIKAAQPAGTGGAWQGQYYANTTFSGTPALVRSDAAIRFDWGDGAPDAALPIDGYSVRWTKSAYFDGTCHTLRTKSDDGIRAFVDGVQVLSYWFDQAGTERTDSVCPSAGAHTVVVEYYEGGGGANVYFSMESAAVRPGTSHGAWYATYFADQYLTPPAAITRDEPAIHFDWALGSPGAGVPTDNFSARWERSVVFDGTCQTFHTRTDDGIRVWLDLTLAVDHWLEATNVDRFDTVCPSAGMHRLTVEMYEGAGDAGAHFDILPAEAVPSTAWRAAYYPNTTLSGSPTLVRNDAAIAFNWVSGSPDASLPADSFSARWMRAIDFDGTCKAFTTSTDDGVRVFLDGAIALDYWNNGGPDRSDTICPAAGRHTVTVEYFEGGGDAKAYVDVLPASNPTPATAALAYHEKITSDSPVGYWRLGESGGGLAFDRTARFTGTHNGGVTLGQAGAFATDFDRAARFNGSTGYVSVPDAAALNPGAITLESWVYLTAYPATSGNMLSKGDNTGYRYRVSSDGSVSFLDRGATNGITSAAGVVPLNQWAHVVATGDASGLKLYVNGVLKASNSTPYGSAPGGVPLYIGATPAFGEYFSGVLDEVAIYSGALSGGQVQAHFDTGSAVRGAVMVSATASDDVGVTRVEFLADDIRFAEDTTAPYVALWDTLGASLPSYDGTRLLTAKAYDTHGQVTTSAALNVSVGNRPATKYQATFTSTDVPQVVTYDPDAQTQEEHGVDVTVTNTSGVTWRAGVVSLRYRWISSDENPTVTEGPLVSLGTDLPAGQSRTLRVMVQPPVLPLGADKQQHQLHFDLWDDDGDAWFGNKGNPPLEHPVQVNKKLKTKLGLEPYYRYATESLGAGMTHLVNVANGNSLLTWTPFSAPSRGLGTAVNLTYNSLEKKSESPVGAGWSLAVSGVLRLGQPLDVHPNNADSLANRSNSKWVEFTDADGSTHRFEGRTATDGSTYWEAPPGVHLYLRVYSTTDAERKWALTTPSRTTFFFDADGYPTYVEDSNGNRLKFTLENTPPGEDPGGPKKRVTKVTDAAGLNVDGTVNPAVTTRSFSITYYAKAEAKKAHVRGKVKRITDHDGSALDFEYYDDGNLRKLVQRGGTSADGSFLADRSFVFTYTTSSGDEAALPEPADRVEPDPGERNQSHQLYSVRDPRGAETLFTYHGPPTSQNRWKLATRTDRAGQVTSFAYDTTTRVTTITAPLSRVTKHTYDADGKVTKTNNALQQDTLFDWNADFQVTKVTEPTAKFVEMTYDANGAITSSKNQLGQTTTFEYQYVQVDANDVSGKWKTGRTHAHIGQLVKQTDPKGVLTATPVDDFQTQFVYDAKGNLTETSDSEQRRLSKKTLFTYYSTTDRPEYNGLLKTQTDPNNNVTTFSDYDANGLSTKIVDALNGTTQFGYDNGGRRLWTQDPAHFTDGGIDVRSYRTYVDYDVFGRPVRTSTPKSTLHDRGLLVWSGATYDANGNVLTQVHPHESRDGFLASKPASGFTLDAMDRRTSATDALGERTEYRYDGAGRTDRVTLPKGVGSTSTDQDYATFFTFDALDRVTKQTQYEVNSSGAVTRTLNTHHCFTAAGDLKWVVDPNANLSSVDCAAQTPPSFTTRFEYDDTHRQTATTDPEGRRQSVTFDANGNVSAIAASPTTTYVYDEADRLQEVRQPYEVDQQGNATRWLTTRHEYDAAGNLARLISPRAYDANPGLSDYTGKPYVTAYEYDGFNRLTRVNLPTSPAYPEPHYQYRHYDTKGRMDWISQPVTHTAEAAVPLEKKTTYDYYDSGLIRTSDDADSLPIRYDYAAEGWQTLRVPFSVDQYGAEVYDERRAMRWAYDTQGRATEHVFGPPAGDQRDTFVYNEHGQPTIATLGARITKDSETAISVWYGYDTANRLANVRHKKQADTNCKITTLTYDLGHRLTDREEDATTAYDATNAVCGETISATGRRSTFTYDTSGRLQFHTDLGDPATGADDQRTETVFRPDTHGWLDRRTIAKTNGAGGWIDLQTTTWDYFANGQAKTLTTRQGGTAGPVLESHLASYDDTAGKYVGYRTRDEFSLQGPAGTSGPCRASACVATYSYDARDRLVSADNGYGGAYTYALDPQGNITTETQTKSAANYPADQVGTTTGAYLYGGSGNRLSQLTVTKPNSATTTERYLHDRYGNLDCITTNSWSGSSCPNAPTLGGPKDPVFRVDYAYDGFDRIDAFRIYTVENSTVYQTDDAKYAYDALDRLVREEESHVPASQGGVVDGAAPQRTSTFTYAALTRALQQEKHENASASTVVTKTYRYDAFGVRTGMSTVPGPAAAADDVAGAFTYGYDLHGSASLLLQDTGALKATYGYEPYSKEDVGLGRGDRTPDQQNPFNPFRYTSYRIDSGSGGMELGNGTRRFSPDFKRFWQRDALPASSTDKALTSAVTNANRYALAAGNPLNFTESDGHVVAPDDSWGYGSEGVSLFDTWDVICRVFPGISVRCGPLPPVPAPGPAPTPTPVQTQAQVDCPAGPTNVLVGYVFGSGDEPYRVQFRTPSTDKTQLCHVNVEIPMKGINASYINWHIYHAGGQFSGNDNGAWLPSLYLPTRTITGTSAADVAINIAIDFEQRIFRELGALASNDHSVIASLMFGVSDALSKLAILSP